MNYRRSATTQSILIFAGWASIAAVVAVALIEYIKIVKIGTTILLHGVSLPVVLLCCIKAGSSKQMNSVAFLMAIIEVAFGCAIAVSPGAPALAIGVSSVLAQVALGCVAFTCMSVAPEFKHSFSLLTLGVATMSLAVVLLVAFDAAPRRRAPIREIRTTAIYDAARTNPGTPHLR